MASTFELEIATPERLLLRENVTDAQVPAKEGYIGVLPDHSPLISELGDGALSYTTSGRKHSMALHGGWVEVLPDRVRVLANIAEKAPEIDVPRAERARDRAQERLAQPSPDMDVVRALAALARAETRIETAKTEGNN